MELRDYQRRCVDVVEQADRSGVVVAPTGSGKSLIIKELADRWQRSGHNVIVVVAELSVSRQLSSEKYGLRCVHPSALADIAARNASNTRLIVDEVHHYVPTNNGGGVWGDWVWKNWAWGRVVGFTATPAHPFLKKRIIVQIPYYYLREGQWLAPPVTAVLCAEGAPALPTAAHAVTYISKKEDWEPWMGRLITAETPAEDRRFKETDAGRLSCIQTLTTGWDDPDIDTVVLARRVGEAHTYMQIIGRLRRGGTIYDMSDNVVRFGLDEDLILATHEKRDKEGSEPVGDGIAVLTTCLQCDRLVSPRLKQCPYCGAALPPPAGKTWVKLDDAGWKVWLDAFAPARLEKLCDGRRPCRYTPSGAYPIQLPIKEQIYFSPKTYHHWKKVSDLLYDLRHRGALMCYIPHSWHILVQQKCGAGDAVPPFYITSIEYGSPLVWQRFNSN